MSNDANEITLDQILPLITLFVYFILPFLDNQKVIDILKGNLMPTNKTNRTMIYRYGSTICKELISTDIVDPLSAVGVLNDKGRQEIHEKFKMLGKWETAFSLIFLLPKKNIDWYQHFISTLLKTDYESLARRIDGILCMSKLKGC